jgi:hypothetical protein
VKNVRMGFSCSRSWKIGSVVLRKYMGTAYSHVYIRYEDSQGRDIVFHAAHGTVHQILHSNFIIENNPIFEYETEISEESYQKLKDFYYEKAGLPYSIKELMFIPIHDLAWNFNYYLKGEDDPGYICSGLAGTVLDQICGIKFEKPYNILRPDDIEKALQKSFNFKKTIPQ